MNLRRIRKVRNMSLDAVAEQTGISKSMLGQIEREQFNPTIAVLGKIVRGLRIDFNDLICMPPFETRVVRGETLYPSKEVKGRYQVYTYFPYKKECSFEVYQIEESDAIRINTDQPHSYLNEGKKLLTLNCVFSLAGRREANI